MRKKKAPQLDAATTAIATAGEKSITDAARRLVTLQHKRRVTARALRALDDEIRIARKFLKAIAVELAAPADEFDTPLANDTE